MQEWRVRDAIGHAAVSENEEIQEVQRGRRDEEDGAFQEADVMNHAETSRGRCKTEIDTKTRREGDRAKINGVGRWSRFTRRN